MMMGGVEGEGAGVEVGPSAGSLLRLERSGARLGWRVSALDIICVWTRPDALQSNESNERG